MSLGQWLQRRWFEPKGGLFGWPLGGWTPLFLPLYFLYRLIASGRRLAYDKGWFASTRLPVPVVVVGNVTVGGAGKTPLSLWLVEALRERGFRPGIISRGYGRQGKDVLPVTSTSDPQQVGDEPLLLARRSGVPVYVGAQRAEAGLALLRDHPGVDVLVCDDGLQHDALARDVELVVVDGRGVGNGCLLPLGPLREPWQRVNACTALVVNGGQCAALPGTASALPVFEMHLVAETCFNLQDLSERIPAISLAGQRLYAAAGIGHPERFFKTLAALGLVCQTRAFDDHHAFAPGELDFARDGVLLLTEKDGVKCAPLYDGPAWVLPVTAQLPSALADLIVEKLRGRQAA